MTALEKLLADALRAMVEDVDPGGALIAGRNALAVYDAAQQAVPCAFEVGETVTVYKPGVPQWHGRKVRVVKIHRDRPVGSRRIEIDIGGRDTLLVTDAVLERIA